MLRRLPNGATFRKILDPNVNRVTSCRHLRMIIGFDWSHLSINSFSAIDGGPLWIDLFVAKCTDQSDVRRKGIFLI